MITDFASLKAELATWLRRDDLGDAIPGFIALGEARIAADPRVRIPEMEAQAMLTLKGQSMAMPGNVLGIKRLLISGYPPLRRVTPMQFWMLPESTFQGQPVYYTAEGMTLSVAPAPDAERTASMLYYQRQLPLSDVNPSTAVLLKHPQLYLYSALVESAPFIRDDARIQTWAAMYDDAAERAEQAARFYEMGPGMAFVPDFFVA